MRDYQAIINEVIEAIKNSIRKGKSHREIIQSIGDLLANYGLNDVRHFDRVHFKMLTTKSLSEFKILLERKRKNIISNISSKDICVLNTIARLIRQDLSSKKYPITKDTFLNQGYNGEDSEKLFEHVRLQSVNQVISEEIEYGFSSQTLITSYESRREEDNEVVYVVPDPLLYYLASQGYDFRERKSERLLKLMSEFREL